jgi:hypothetical protein
MFRAKLTFVLLTFAATSVVFAAATSDVATIRTLRLENNRAIVSRNVTLMRAVWMPNIQLIVSDGTVYSGSACLAQSYANTEFKDPRFIAYVRRPSSITISADGVHAAEYGTWTAIYKPPKNVQSGTYLASWRKFKSAWKIIYEAYVELNLTPQ